MIIVQTLLFSIGLLHAMAAYFYFSKERGAAAWAVAWLAFSALCAWLIRLYPLPIGSVFLAVVVWWTIWWVSIPALIDRHWIPEDMRQATGAFVNDRLTVYNVRNFVWQGRHEFTARWETRVYNPNALAAIDLFVCTWGDPNIAHLIVSFVFEDVPPLAFSIETRREASEKWSILAGFMKSYELIAIAADERDVIRVRTNVRHETVKRYRIASTPQMRRNLLAHYVGELNDLAAKPRFYNTLFRNCTTEVMRILRAAGRPIPCDWRLLISGHLPHYLHRHGLLDTHASFENLEAAADISSRARDADAFPDFSDRIRRNDQNRTH